MRRRADVHAHPAAELVSISREAKNNETGTHSSNRRCRRAVVTGAPTGNRNSRESSRNHFSAHERVKHHTKNQTARFALTSHTLHT